MRLRILCALSLFFTQCYSEIIDLEANPQSFILETKQLNIENYPDAFNPCLLEYEGAPLLLFRIRDPITKSTNQVGYIWLDENLDPIGTPKVLRITLPPNSYPNLQDPRVVKGKDTYYIVFNNITTVLHQDRTNRRMYVAELKSDDHGLYTTYPQEYIDFEDEKGSRQEKNWGPFIFNDSLLLEYMVSPHVIYQPLQNSDCCLTTARDTNVLNWKWGEIRGGTPLLLVDGEYLGFFHSSTNLSSVQSNGVFMQHYFMGAYTFSNDPSFTITKMSPDPIIGKKFYDGPAHKTWKPLRVVFPGGYLFDENYIWLAYGRQDHEVWIVKFDKAGLYNSLIPVRNEHE